MEKEGDGLSTKEYTTTLSLIIAFRVLATVGVVTHLGLRKCRRIRLALDDWLLLLTSLLFWAQAAIEIIRDMHGRADVLSIYQLSTYYKLWLADGVFFALVMTMARSSILLAMLRMYTYIFQHSTGDATTRKVQPRRIPCFITFAWNSAWCIFTILITLLQCLPESIAWESSSNTDHQCLSLVGVVLGVSIWDLTCTVTMLCTVYHTIKNSRAGKYQKLPATLVCLSAGGIFAVEIARVVIGAQLHHQGPSGSNTEYSELAPLESSLAILAASSFSSLQAGSSDHPASTVYAAKPYHSRRETARAIRDRILIGKDTYHPRYYPTYKRSSEIAGLTQPEPVVANTFVSGGAQVDSEPVLMPRSGWDPLPRYAEMRHGASHTFDEIQVEQEVYIEMENMEPRSSATS